MNRLASHTGWVLVLIVLLATVAGCGSPQEKAYKRAMRDYQRGSKEARAYAQEQNPVVHRRPRLPQIIRSLAVLGG